MANGKAVRKLLIHWPSQHQSFEVAQQVHQNSFQFEAESVNRDRASTPCDQDVRSSQANLVQPLTKQAFCKHAASVILANSLTRTDGLSTKPAARVPQLSPHVTGGHAESVLVPLFNVSIQACLLLDFHHWLFIVQNPDDSRAIVDMVHAADPHPLSSMVDPCTPPVDRLCVQQPQQELLNFQFWFHQAMPVKTPKTYGPIPHSPVTFG